MLVVFGTETASGFDELVRSAAEGVPVSVKTGRGGYAASDQTSFSTRDVPVLFFFTGIHGEYHTPDDDAVLVDAEGESEVLRVVYRVARALLDADGRPELIAREPHGGGGGQGYGPYLGTVPNFTDGPGRGVLLQGVRPGSPAAAAGLRRDDRIITFDGAPVANLEEYAALLFASQPGQRVEIVVERAGARFGVEAILGQRR